MKHAKLFEKPMVTVDIVVFTIENKKLKTLLIRRKYAPFKDKWALPGGFVRAREELEEAALRELKEETGVGDVYLEQLYTFGKTKRDPRGRIITVSYVALISRDPMRLKASHDARAVRTFSISSLPDLAFDHKEIISYALTRLRNKIQYTNVAWSILPKTFTLGEIQKVYEIILGKHMDKRNFRKKILSLGMLFELRKVRRGLRQRPARLYTFRTRKYAELRKFF